MTEKERNIIVGNRIKEARTLRNMTLDEIASEVKVAKSTIQRYEAAKIQSLKMPVIEAIAKSLNVNPVWLIGEDVPMKVTHTDKLKNYIRSMLGERTSDAVKINNHQVCYNVIIDAENIELFEKTFDMNISDEELSMLEKYRFLDEHGKDMTDTVIEKEYNRCKEDAENTIELTDEQIERLKLEKYLKGSQELMVARKVKK